MKKIICLMVIVVTFTFPGCNISNTTADLERVNLGEVSISLDRDAIENNSDEFNYYFSDNGVLIHCLAKKDKNSVRSYIGVTVNNLNGNSIEEMISSMIKLYEGEGHTVTSDPWKKDEYSGIEITFDSASIPSNQSMADRTIVFMLPDDEEYYYLIGGGYERDATEKETQVLYKTFDDIIDSLDASSTEYKSVGYYCGLAEQMQN